MTSVSDLGNDSWYTATREICLTLRLWSQLYRLTYVYSLTAGPDWIFSKQEYCFQYKFCKILAILKWLSSQTAGS